MINYSNRFSGSIKSIVLFLIIAGILPLMVLQSEEKPLQKWISFSRTGESNELIAWLRSKIREEIAGEKCDCPFNIECPLYFGRFGIFITLKKGRRVRGCYGAFDHRSDCVELMLTEYLRGALRSDPRYEPVDISEIDEIDIIVTIAERPFPVRDINLLDISRYGIIVTDENNNKTVFVPAEARSIDYLKNRLKGKGIIQIAAFRVVTIRSK